MFEPIHYNNSSQEEKVTSAANFLPTINGAPQGSLQHAVMFGNDIKGFTPLCYFFWKMRT